MSPVPPTRGRRKVPDGRREDGGRLARVGVVERGGENTVLDESRRGRCLKSPARRSLNPVVDPFGGPVNSPLGDVGVVEVSPPEVRFHLFGAEAVAFAERGREPL